MIIIKEEGNFTIEYFGGKIFDTSYDEIDGSYYTSVAPTNVIGSVDTKYTISGIASLNITKGDVVNITGDDGIVDDYIVVGVGTDIIRVKDVIKSDIGTNVTVQTNIYKITFGSEIEEGMYYLDTNDVIIVANTFSNTYINKAKIQLRYSELDDGKDVDLMNDDAKEALIGDFPLNPTFYKTLNLGQITELLKRKIISILELSDKTRDKNNQPLTDDYHELLISTVNILNTKDNNTPNGDITDNTVDLNAGGIPWKPKV